MKQFNRKKVEPLNEKEAGQLEELLKRAIGNGQLGLNVASPFEVNVVTVGGGESARNIWEKYGFDFNDRHDGNSVSGCLDWNVETVFMDGEAEHAKVSIYVDDDSLCFLAGISIEEADAVVAARKARSAKGGRSKSPKKKAAAQKNQKKAVKAKKV